MFTTARYSSLYTRKFTKKIAEIFNVRYVARGKKTIYDIVESARKFGNARIVIIKEKNCKPYAIDFIEVKEDLKWQWLNDVIIIKDDEDEK